MKEPRDDPQYVLERLWPRLLRAVVALAGVNLLLAVVIRVGGGDLHPLFSDPHAWLLFVVAAVSLLAQAGCMLAIIHTMRTPMRAVIPPERPRRAAGIAAVVHGRRRTTRHAGLQRRIAGWPLDGAVGRLCYG